MAAVCPAWRLGVTEKRRSKQVVPASGSCSLRRLEHQCIAAIKHSVLWVESLDLSSYPGDLRATSLIFVSFNCLLDINCL